MTRAFSTPARRWNEEKAAATAVWCRGLKPAEAPAGLPTTASAPSVRRATAKEADDVALRSKFWPRGPSGGQLPWRTAVTSRGHSYFWNMAAAGMKPLLHSPSNQPTTICFRASEAHMKAKMPQNTSSEIFLRNPRGWWGGRCSEAETVN